MDVLEAVLRRRSTRKFKDEKLTKEEVGELLDAVRWTPSAGNTQPWEIIVVKDNEIKENLADIALEQNWIKSAPVVLVVCLNKELAEKNYGERGTDLYGIQATGAAVQNILLRATEMGLASCWVGAFDEDQASVELNCEGIDRIRPVAMIPVGHPEKIPEAPPRRRISSFTHIDGYNKKDLRDWKGLNRYAKKIKLRTEKFLKSANKELSDCDSSKDK